MYIETHPVHCMNGTFGSVELGDNIVDGQYNFGRLIS